MQEQISLTDAIVEMPYSQSAVIELWNSIQLVMWSQPVGPETI